MEENKNFALKVKSIRERQQMTIEEVAEKSGVKIDVLKAKSFITKSIFIFIQPLF